MADHGRDDRGSLDHVGDWPVKSPTILRARLISFSMRALGPYLLSRCCASALLSPFGLDGELGKDLVDRQLLEVDRGLRSALGRSRSGLQSNGGHGLLLGTRLRESKKGVSKDNAMWLVGRHQRPAHSAGY